MSEASSTTSTSPETESEQRTIRKRVHDLILGSTAVGFIARGTLIPLLIYALIFALGFWRAWVDPEGSAAFFEFLRGLFDIVVTIGSILIVLAIGVLIIQIARFVNLLRSEVKPITEDTKEAIKSVRVTAQFVQKNAVAPILNAQAFIAGLIAFLLEISRISKILQRRDEENETDEDDSDEPES